MQCKQTVSNSVMKRHLARQTKQCSSSYSTAICKALPAPCNYLLPEGEEVPGIIGWKRNGQCIQRRLRKTRKVKLENQ